jgi:hypothetical protein
MSKEARMEEMIVEQSKKIEEMKSAIFDGWQPVQKPEAKLAEGFDAARNPLIYLKRGREAMSTEPTVNIPSWPTSSILHEIEWCEKRIELLQPKLLRKPRTKREINDLLRQIEDKRKVLRFRGIDI